MNQEMMQKLKYLREDDEKYRKFPYKDSQGYLTIGIGRCLSTCGISYDESLFLLENDIKYAYEKLSKYLPFFNDLSDNRQIALLNMCVTIGVFGFLNFKKMISALDRHDYNAAANEMLDSDWAKQVGDRAIRLANIVRTNQI